jgi:hypothetical protein
MHLLCTYLYFFLLGFLNIVFILYDVQLFKGGVTTQIYSDHLILEPTGNCRASASPGDPLSNRRVFHHRAASNGCHICIKGGKE